MTLSCVSAHLRLDEVLFGRNYSVMVALSSHSDECWFSLRYLWPLVCIENFGVMRSWKKSHNVDYFLPRKFHFSVFFAGI